mmetsp:Transcript_27313/g.64724  ORF Transcript_27313/g.64724 Transcript_27313/m.64724 type:complete len:115 (+) Transcript_27313:161-505(+)
MCEFDPVDGISSWFVALWRTRQFRHQVVNRWKTLRITTLRTEIILDIFHSTARLIQNPVRRNFRRWNGTLFQGGFVDNTAQWNYHVRKMENWLVSRLAWMDTAIQEIREVLRGD